MSNPDWKNEESPGPWNDDKYVTTPPAKNNKSAPAASNSYQPSGATNIYGSGSTYAWDCTGGGRVPQYGDFF